MADISPQNPSSSGCFDKKVNVRDLRVGMYVTRLDRDWLETPYLMQGFAIASSDDIKQLSHYCEAVWVHDTDIPFTDSNDTAIDLLPGSKAPTPEVPIQQEHATVKKLMVEARRFTKQMLTDVRLGRSIEEKKARKIVDHNVQSVMRNPDALAWMTRLRDEDQYTAEHCLNVCILALIFGRSLGMPEDQMSNLGLCGLLHDVGKIRVPDEILNKPGKLNDKEMVIMRAHAAHGRKLLSASKNMYEGAIEVAYCHHERPDGKGYPQGLAADSISLFSKIISIVDVYDAMTCDRVYASAKPTTEALKILYECRGTQFDENLVLAFIQTIGLYPPGSIVTLKNGCVGLVVETNERSRHLPKVLIMRDQERQECSYRLVDLSLTLTGELSTYYQIKSVESDGFCDISLRECYRQGFVNYL